jgi:hypothetical protein
LSGVASPHDTTDMGEAGTAGRFVDSIFWSSTGDDISLAATTLSFSSACASSPTDVRKRLTSFRCDKSEIVHSTISRDQLLLLLGLLRFARCRVAASSVGGCCIRGPPGVVPLESGALPIRCKRTHESVPFCVNSLSRHVPWSGTVLSVSLFVRFLFLYDRLAWCPRALCHRLLSLSLLSPLLSLFLSVPLPCPAFGVVRASLRCAPVRPLPAPRS